tara:strand:- start:1374 stop:1649 length:276 start_codon:yes stop_codon:yes gene_type:complete
MPIHSNQFAVGTAAIVQIVAPDVEPQKVWIHESDHSASTILYLGNAQVTTATGLHLHPEQTLEMDIPPNDGVWAISGAGTPTVHVMRVTQH